ncbi:MAG: ATP-binding protein [Pseudanabaena sp.]|jgi:hypothetical protein
MQESKEKNIVCAFAHELAVFSGAKSLLHIQASQFNLFYDLYDLEFQEVNATANITENARYDLILGDLPLGLNVVEWKDGDGTIKTRQNWLEILKSLNHLEINGIGLFLLEPVGFSSNAGVIFENELNQRGLFVNSYINLPPSILEPYTSLVPVFVVISKKKSNKLFVVELLDDKQAREVARNYCSGVYGDNLANGKYIEASDYHGFYRIKVKDQIERLETQYKSYKEYKLGDLASIKSISKDKHFKECDNTMYIHKSKNSEIVCKISDIKFDHSNYFQVILEDVVINEYLALFFRSALGKLIIESLKSGEFRPVLAQSYLEQAIITLPTLEEQKDIVHTQNKLQVLKQAIDNFDSELALNPTNSSAILGQLDMMLDAINSLTDADKVRAIVREGETKYVEFKETFSLDINKQTKETYIETSALKTVVAFLNTDGGKLLIGISATGEILGLDAEINKLRQKNLDRFLLHWKNCLKERIGEEYYPFIETRVIKIDTKYVLVVECKSSKSPCFLDKKDFYVRTNPASDKLDGAKLVEYVKHHFK